MPEDMPRTASWQRSMGPSKSPPPPTEETEKAPTLQDPAGRACPLAATAAHAGSAEVWASRRRPQGLTPPQMLRFLGVFSGFHTPEAKEASAASFNGSFPSSLSPGHCAGWLHLGRHAPRLKETCSERPPPCPSRLPVSGGFSNARGLAEPALASCAAHAEINEWHPRRDPHGHRRVRVLPSLQGRPPRPAQIPKKGSRNTVGLSALNPKP